MDKKPNSQSKARKGNKLNGEVKQQQEPLLDFEETHRNVYEEPQFAGELLAKSFIDHLIDEGAKVLYDHYIQTKVAQHTTDSMFTMIDDMIRLQFRKQDNRFNDHSEIKENHIPKIHYDAHSAFAINVDKKQINLDEEYDNEPDPLQANQPGSPYRTQKTFNSTRSKLRPMSSTITEETIREKKKKPEHDLIPIPEPEQTNEDIVRLNEEAKMRTIYNLQLKELQRKKEQEKQRQEEEKKVEELKKKMRKDLDGKSYTYDYNGQPIFFTKKKQPEAQLVCAVPYQIKTSKQKDTLDEVIEGDISKMSIEQKEDYDRIKQIAKMNGNASFNDKAKRKQSTLSQVSNADQSINRRSSIDSKQRMEEALKKKILNIPIVDGQEVPAKQRTLKLTAQPAPPIAAAKLTKKDEVPDEIYNNGNMRQTSMIPYMTIRDGVKLTEFVNGNEVTKLPEEKGAGGDQDEGKKKQMTRNAYFKMIEDSRFQEPQFRQQLSNSRGTFTQRTDLHSRENIPQSLEETMNFEKEEKKQRIASLLIEDQHNQSDNEDDMQKENSVYQASASGYKPEPIVIKDNTVKRKRINSNVDGGANTNVQYKYNNINPNYFKNYVPNPQLAADKKPQGDGTENGGKNKSNVQEGRTKRSVTYDSQAQQQQQQPSVLNNSNKANNNNNLNTSKNDSKGGDTQGVVLPLIPVFQKKKQALLQNMFNQEQQNRVSSSKQRQRTKNLSVTNGNYSNGNVNDNQNANINKLNITTTDTFGITKSKFNKIPQYLNNSKYLNKSMEMQHGGLKKHSTTIVEQNQKDKHAAQLDKNRNIITFGKNEQLVHLLVNE